MASTNKTDNLKLNQWIGTDIPKWEDHNEDNRKIDAIYKGVTSPPRVSDTTGNWEVYDWTLKAYVDTGVYAGGTSLQIKGTYATLADLQAAVTSPAQGDMYNVGTTPSYNIYMYDNGAWADQGVLQGEKGDTGAGVPVGGAAGQKLTKKSATDFDTDWEDDVAVQIADRVYQGVDLTVTFAEEITASPYNGDVWAWIKARAQAGNFAGIHVGDYIPFTASNGYAIKAEIAGMDTYYRYGDTAVGHHIDFISRDCWPDQHAYNKVNYNNGTSVSASPWLASDLYAWLNSLAMNVPNAETADPALVAVDYTTTGVYDKLPAALKNVIVQKRLLLPIRYAAGSLLTADNSWAWADAGKLWLPSEIEVNGIEHWGSKNGYSGGSYQQYPIFAQNMERMKGAGDGGGGANWYLSSSPNGNSTNCIIIYYNGFVASPPITDGAHVPMCFRIA